MIRTTLFLSLLALLPVSAEPPGPATPPEADPARLTADGYRPLFDGKSLKGWEKVGGTGEYEVANNAIVGFGKNIRGNTFLRTRKTYSDFILVFQFRFIDRSGNSGCQFRSEQRDGDGRVFGYQCEHDNNAKRSFTAGVYDEARRGWLYPGKMSAKEVAAQFTAQGERLFKWDDWNTIVIKCDGRHIQTWLNGEKRADFQDEDEKNFTPEGFIALQVHGGKSGHIEWRNLYLKELPAD
jgi:hypothetical protein